MIFGRSLTLLLLALGAAKAQLCAEPGLLTCHPVVGDLPVLDGDLSDWADVVGMETSLYAPLTLDKYGNGKATVKCAHSGDRVFMTLEVPGKYRFSVDDNKLCPSIATMMKMGVDATFYNMGGCTDAQAGCDIITGAVPATCETYKVDVGAHWEFRTTEQGVTYPMNDGTGNDIVANKDDEYAVSSFCRLDDDDADAGNEWAAGWSHSAGTEQGADGTYRFEFSRLLTTPSVATDAQMAIGGTYEFGVAYWDPNQLEEGWTDSHHYVSGCGRDWFDLVLSPDPYEPPVIIPPPESCIVEDIECENFMGELPVLDGDIAEWSHITGMEIPLYAPLTSELYAPGKAEVKCAHSEDRLFLTLSVPGKYRFSADSNNLCAAIGTMMRIGEDASFYGMGGCLEAQGGCDAITGGVPTECDAYRVDIGAHWELASTRQGVTYPINTNSGTGDDPVGNKDDEYAVSPFCRLDDDGAGAGNAWAGAWSHSAGTEEEGADGTYIFELSRLLKTASTTTTAQMTIGETYDFGLGFWDPNQKEDGWSDSNHYVSGCASDWLQLTLVPVAPAAAPTAAPTDSAVPAANKWLANIVASAGVCVMALFF